MKRILIVDDEEPMTHMMEAALSSNDSYVVDVTNDPHEAYEWASTRTYDLLISDVQMPSLDGHKLYLYLGIDPSGSLKKVKRPPLLLISGAYNDHELREFVDFVEGTTWLKKPFDLSTFHIKVAEALWKGRSPSKSETVLKSSKD